MSILELLASGGISVIAILSLIQVVPIKINPWSKIARAMGRAMNVEVMEKLNENEANTARYRILRFDDEIRHGTKHTKEHFDQIMDDIDKYERYCREHPEYPNSKAVLAIENIKYIYQKCKKENSFL